MEVIEAFVVEWQKHKCLWDVKLGDIKIAMLENLGGIIWNYVKLFYIAKASPKQFFVFFFVLFFFLFEIIAMAIAAAVSSLLIVLSVEIKVKEFK